MLQQLRDRAQNFKWILWAVIFSFLISFVVIFQGGVGGMSQLAGGGNDAARVAGRPIREEEFRTALIRQEETLRQILGAQYDANQYLNPRNVLDALIDRAILLEEAERTGVEPSRDEVAAYIKDITAFQDEAGKFDRKRYAEYLERAGLRATEFEKQVADDLSVSAMNRLLASGAAVPVAAVKDAWKRENESASAEYVTFPLAPHVASVSVSEEEAKAHYDAHQAEYDAGPARQIRWVRFAREDYQKGLEDEAAMRAYYDENVASIYTMTEDQRRASVILVTVPPGADEAAKAAARAKAEGAAARAKAGEDFAALARELSDDAATKDKGGDLGPFYQGFQEPAVDAAVFAAAEGDVLGPIETLRGFEVVLVTKGAGSKARPFEEVRELVGRGLYAGPAAEAQAEALKKFQDALAANADFDKAADAAGLKASEPRWLARGGTIEELGPNPMIAARAFDLEVGSIGDPVSDPGGQVIFQVVAEREESPQTFEEARATVETAVRERKARDLARAEAETFRQNAAAATSLGAVAIAEGPAAQVVQTATDIRRGRAVAGLGVAPDFVTVAFETPVGQVGRVADVPEGVAVVRVTERTEFDEARFEADRDALAQRLSDQQAASLRSSAIEHLREEYGKKIKINEDVLRAYAPQQAQGG
jgi:peptidyl-prolyl cis-trans isomerase D